METKDLETKDLETKDKRLQDKRLQDKRLQDFKTKDYKTKDLQISRLDSFELIEHSFERIELIVHCPGRLSAAAEVPTQEVYRDLNMLCTFSTQNPCLIEYFTIFTP